MRELQTHFEQIPVERVKKIATEISDKDDNTQIPVGEKAQVASSPQETWRVLAERVQNERDPKKMIELVQQLIDTLEEKPPSMSR